MSAIAFSPSGFGSFDASITHRFRVVSARAGMQRAMRTMREKFEVARSVVGLVVVDVMHVLIGAKDSPELLSHNKPMFRHVAFRVGHRMVPRIHDDVAAAHEASALPQMMLRSTFPRTMTTNVRHRMSGEVSTFPRGSLRDAGRLATLAFTQTRRDLTYRWFVSRHRHAHSIAHDKE